MLLTLPKVDPETRPSNIGPPFTGHFRITADTPRGLQAYQPAPCFQLTPGKPATATERLVKTPISSKTSLSLDVRRNIYENSGKEVASLDAKNKSSSDSAVGLTINGLLADDVAKKVEDSIKEPPKQYFCYSCGVDCTRVRYHHSRSEPGSLTDKTAVTTKYDLCPSCYLEARFPNSTSAVDWINVKWNKIEDENYPGFAEKEAPWTDSELLLLLEGLEMFDDDWNSVSDHVGSRTREECVLKFLQLEIEDKYLEPEPNAEVTSTGLVANLGYLSNGYAPFTQADNPVLSVMSFLAGLVDPNVTAAAAGKSVDEMRRSMRERIEKANKGQTSGVEVSEEDRSSTHVVPALLNSSPINKAEIVKAERPDVMDVDQEIDDDNARNMATTAALAMSSSSSSLASSEKSARQQAFSSDPSSKKQATVSHADSQSLERLTTIPLALTAARSAALASHQERHITRLVSQAINVQVQKLELKLAQFSDMESILAAERHDLERRKQQLFMERLTFQKRVQLAEEDLKKRMESFSLSSGEGYGKGNGHLRTDVSNIMNDGSSGGNLPIIASSLAPDAVVEDKLLAVSCVANSIGPSGANTLTVPISSRDDVPEYSSIEI